MPRATANFSPRCMCRTQRRVILIHDGVPYHRAAYTKTWLSTHAKRVTV
jgi:hypothetical protein